jgi:hypothetical protein
MFRSSLPTALAALLFGGCLGTVEDTDPEDTFTPGPAAMRRLTRAEYQATLKDLFGDDLDVPTDLEVDTALHGYSSVGASELTISPHGAEQYEAAAMNVARQVFGDEARRTALVGCTPTSAADPCVRTFLETFGRRAWRRPLTAGELDLLGQIATTVADAFRDPWSGVEYAVVALLESPYFVFRVEVGTPDGSGRLRYDGWEMASRLSYLLLGTTPDDTLLDAAAAGELVTNEGIRAHAERLLESPRARAAVGTFFAEYLNLTRLETVAKNTELFPQALSPTLIGAMRTEVARLVEEVVFDRDADLRELLDTRVSWVNEELAALYGVPAPASPGEDGFGEAALPEGRGGLLTTAAMLSLYAHESVTSPTLRGKFIRQNLLCQDVPPPPPGVVTTLDEGDGSPETMRDKLARHRENPLCAGCHDLMDPLGLSLEHFDALGVWRDTDGGLPLDVSGELDGVPFDGAGELGALLRGDPRVGACVARQFYRHAQGHLETDGELPLIEDLAARFEAGGFRFRALIVDLVVSDAFRMALPNDALPAPPEEMP